MRTLMLVNLHFLFLLTSVIATEPKPTAPETTSVSEDDTTTIAQLLERIRQLEKRIADLETARPQNKPGDVSTSTETDQNAIPSGIRIPNTLTYQKPLNLKIPPTIQPMVPGAKTGVPQTRNDQSSRNWHPFQFNGQTVYIIPLTDRSGLNLNSIKAK